MLQTAFLTVAGYSLQATIVILVVILVRLLLRKLGAPTVVSYALWAVVLFRLLCPVSIESSVGVIPEEMARVPQEHAVVDYEYVSPETALISGALVFSNVLDGSLDGADFAYESEEYGPNGDGQGKLFPEEALLLTLGSLWPVGIAAMVTYSVIAYFRLRRKLVEAVPLEGNIRLADHITSPFVMGLFRPKIYLPSNLSECEREYIILHERHHIRRLDHIVKILAFAALCIHWFNPLVWLAFYLSGKDMEMSCDEAVVKKLGEGIRADYSASLLSLATGRTVIAATPLAFGEGDTKGRIRNLAKWKKPAVWSTVAAVILCAAVIVLCATNSSKESRLKVRIASGGIEVTCRFDDGVVDWAVYEDLYQEGKLISSKALLVNGEHPKAADTAKKFEYVFKINMTAADGGGFASPLQFHAVDGSETIASREVELPYETYGAFMMCAGDHEAFPMKRKLSVNGEAILFSAVLSLDEGTTVNLEDGVVEHNDTVVQYRLVTADTVRDWAEETGAEQPPRQFGPDQIYVSERCLYLAPYSSYYPAGGDSGYRYLMGDDGFYMVNRSNGTVSQLATGAGWEQWSGLPWSMQEWKDLFWFEGTGMVLLSGEVERKYCPLSENAFLLRIDGALWLVELNLNEQMGPHIYSIYTLVPEGAKGAAQWEFAPILSSRMPWFRFELDMEYDEISAACGERMLVDVDGEKASDHALMFPAGHAMYWTPVDGEQIRAEESAIYFTALKDGKNICSGTIYIQGTPIEETGTVLYTAHLVGTGLVMEQNPDGGAIIRLR